MNPPSITMKLTAGQASRRIAMLALVAFAGVPAQAQDAPAQSQTAPEQVQAAPSKDGSTEPGGTESLSGEALIIAARNIQHLLEDHNMRLQRIDQTLAYYRSEGQEEKVRLFLLLRERQLTEYQESLATYRRLLGEPDFDRVCAVLRKYMNEGERRRDGETTVSEADRVAAARRAAAAQEDLRRRRVAEQAALDRSEILARARASQRLQLARRLEQARQDQLAQRIQNARRYQPTPPASRGSAADVNRRPPAPPPRRRN
jgi:hypothetical protein